MTDPLDFDGLVRLGKMAARIARRSDLCTLCNKLRNRVDCSCETEARAILRAVLPHVLAGPREALEIVACKRQCLDNLMSNRDVAEAGLAWIDKLAEGAGI